MDQYTHPDSPAGTLNIDGAMGEGGGQLLRSALALSICSQRPFRMRNLRAARQRPGLQPQHLVAVQAAASICRASVEGMSLGSQNLLFEPARVIPGEYEFDIGTAGSTGLVLQTLLPALVTAKHPSQVTLRGGTHNPNAPCYEFLAGSFIPMLQEMGADVRIHLRRSGYYPRGGGEIHVDIQPVRRWQHLVLVKRGELLNRQVLATIAHLPRHIAERELQVLGDALGLSQAQMHLHEDREAYGPGNVVSVCLQYDKVKSVFSGFGRKGVPAERVAGELAARVQAYLDSEAPVEPYLADQLLIYLALSDGGKFLTLKATQHLLSNAAIIEMFLPVRIRTTEIKHNEYYVSLQ